MSANASIERYFRVISYLVAMSGLFALFASGGIGVLIVTAFVLVTVLAWKLEDSKWQLSERVALGIVGLSILLFLADWKFGISGIWTAGIFAATGLARLILLLCAIKLLQKKTDKDWIFIYVISFFEILLAAGLSISPLYLVSLFSFLLLTTSAIVAFEIRRSSRVEQNSSSKKVFTGIRRIGDDFTDKPVSLRRLPYVSVLILVLITVLGLPIFFSLPRGSAAGLASTLGSPVSITGFSDSVTLGSIGNLQQSNEIVMRVRIDQNNNPNLKQLLWKGVALDRFDNVRWQKSKMTPRMPFTTRSIDKLLLLDKRPSNTSDVTVQTFFMEPVGTNVVFGLSRPFGIKGLELVNRDSEGGLYSVRSGLERSGYTLYSDTAIPSKQALRKDPTVYKEQYLRYLQVPRNLDSRISELAMKYVEEAGAKNSFDIATSIEKRLQSDFGYSLEMKATGEQPVADFLFRVKEGHCEYFASAMAMMLRTQGIATRVVNGFQGGDFNSTAGVYVVRQQNAHSWVEVYFPETDSWVAFNPTPEAGNPSGRTSLFSSMSGFSEALETFWIQYVVAYDGQEQTSLFNSFKNKLVTYSGTGGSYLLFLQNSVENVINDFSNDPSVTTGIKTAFYGVIVLFLLTALTWILIRVWRLISKISFLRRLFQRRNQHESVYIEFYEDLIGELRDAGFVRNPSQTPREFAQMIGFAGVEKLTDVYHQVRFGKQELDQKQIASVEVLMNGVRDYLDNIPPKNG